MVTSYEEIMNKLPEARREKILAESERLLAEYPTLHEFEKAKDSAQAQLAKMLNIDPDGISRIEKQSDFMFTTVRSHVEAMGGKLTLTIEFPDHVPVTLDGLGYDDVYIEDIVQQREPGDAHDDRELMTRQSK